MQVALGPCLSYIPVMAGRHHTHCLELLIAALLFPALLSASPREPRLSQVKSFALALGVILDDQALGALSQYDLVVVDGAETNSDEIQRLKDAGSLVLGYLSVGTVERNRPWFSKVKSYRLDFWKDWGEWYADVSSGRYRKIMLGVGRALSDKGFDGLFLDNIDVTEVYPGMRGDMRRLVASFAGMLHGRAKLLFSQNGERGTARIAQYLDGWNREGVTSDYNFDRRKYQASSPQALQRKLSALERLSSLGLLVTITNYVGPSDAAAQSAGCLWGCAHGFPAYSTDINLSIVPPCCRCQ